MGDSMTDVEKKMYGVLLALDTLAIIVSMIAGPLGYDVISIAASASAIIVSCGLIFYGLYFWRRRER